MDDLEQKVQENGERLEQLTETVLGLQGAIVKLMGAAPGEQSASGVARSVAVIEAITKRMDQHESTEMKVWEDNQDFQKQVGQSIITLNHEMGEVQGALGTLKWLMGGTFLGILGNIVAQVLLNKP